MVVHVVLISRNHHQADMRFQEGQHLLSVLKELPSQIQFSFFSLSSNTSPKRLYACDIFPPITNISALNFLSQGARKSPALSPKSVKRSATILLSTASAARSFTPFNSLPVIFLYLESNPRVEK